MKITPHTSNLAIIVFYVACVAVMLAVAIGLHLLFVWMTRP